MCRKCILLLMLCISFTIALFSETGGFVAPSLEVVTVEQAKSLPDETPVLLQGKIIKALDDEDYTFADETGTIVIEVDDDVWQGVYISEDDFVEIKGEIDKEILSKIKISVDSIRIIVEELPQIEE